MAKADSKLWLFKEEPTHYSFADLCRDGSTTWEGVSNPLALIYLRQCQPGDRVFYYHTGKEKALVGVMEITKVVRPQDENSKGVSVSVRPIGLLPHPVTLAVIKGEKALSSWELVKISRLSIMPVTKQQWNLVMKLAEKLTQTP